MSNFWSGWIIILTVGNILACFWLIWWTMRRRGGEAAQGDVTGHTWDGNLQEYNNPLPRWWLWLFYLTLIFAAAYLALFPGLGQFKGFLGWSSACDTPWAPEQCVRESQLEKEMAKARKKYEPIYEQYAAVAVANLATEEQYGEARDMGKRLFLTYCMQCHGSDARGSRGYPDLTDDNWIWGGEPEQIRTSIAQGRTAVMPSHAHLGEEAIDNVAQYVLQLSGQEADRDKAEAGKQTYTTAGCIGCHGPQGKGNPLLGAPDLTDANWLYGGSVGAIKESIAKGRNGVMPAHQELLGDNKVHILTAYVYSLSAE